ncbi:MAG: hypothetical protein NVS3B26_10260 [Mycobacteriales bacterium]
MHYGGCGPRLRILVPWLVVWLTILPFAILRAGTLAEADTFWQIRTGEITIEKWRIPTHDTFSWTVNGHAWKLNSWLFNVVLAAAYRLGGLIGVALVCAGLVAVICGLALYLARRSGASPVVAALLIWPAFALLMTYLSARPQLIDYAAVLALVALLSRLETGRKPARALPMIFVLMLAWINLHAAALLGVGLTGATALLGFLLTGLHRRTIGLLAAWLVAMLACLLNPYGFGLISQSMHVMRASQGIITEWRPVDVGSPQQLIFLIAGSIALVHAARARNATFTAALATTMVGAITAIRFMPIMLLLSIPILAKLGSRESILRYISSRRTMLAQGAALGVSSMIILAGVALTHLGRPALGVFPNAALQAIPRNCRVFTTDLIGGLLILKRPDVLVSLDSRNDLYGRQRDEMAIRILTGDSDFQRELGGANCILVPPGVGLVRRLDDSGQWRRLSAEPAAVLYVRPYQRGH